MLASSTYSIVARQRQVLVAVALVGAMAIMLATSSSLPSSLFFAVAEASASSVSFIELHAFQHLSRRHHQNLGHERCHAAPLDCHSCCRCRHSELQSQLLNNHDEADDIEEDEGDEDDDRANASSYVTKTRFLARAAYCGTAHSGWQAQRRRQHHPNYDSITSKLLPTTTTIQGEIEHALSTRFRRTIPVVGASRTDAGVHARGQAFHFDLLSSELPPLEISSTASPIFEVEEDDMESGRQKKSFGMDEFCSKLQHSMNRMLPSDIRIFNLQLAPSMPTTKASTNYSTKTLPTTEVIEVESSAKSPSSRPWHAIQSAKAKWYSYRFTLGPTLRNPMDRYTRTHFVHRPSFAHRRFSRSSSSATSSNETTTATAVVEQQQQQHQPNHPRSLTKLDMDRLQDILKLFEGTHDFRAFGGQLEQNEKKRKAKLKDKQFDTVRTVYKVELIKETEDDGNNINETTDVFFFHGEEGNYRIDFLLQGALYKMVRNMVGTAMECWLGRMSEEQIVNMLAQNNNSSNSNNTLGGGNDDNDDGDDDEYDDKNAHNSHRHRPFQRKDNPCKPAPPEGLTLECVYYDDGF